MAIIGSTIGQPSFYTSLGLAPQGEPGYSRTAEWVGCFNGVNSAGSAIGYAHVFVGVTKSDSLTASARPLPHILQINTPENGPSKALHWF